MANVFSNNSKTKLFAAAVMDNLPFIMDARSYLADQVEGKKSGMTYRFYIPDPGVAEAGTSNLTVDDTSPKAGVYEREITCQLLDGKAVVSLTSWNKMTNIESFVEQIANPRGRRTGSEINKAVINSEWVRSFGVVTGYTSSNISMQPLADAAALLRGIKSDGKHVGFGHPTIFGALGVKALSNFVPNEINKTIYEDGYLGRYNKVEWIEEQFCPVLKIGATAPAITGVTLSGSTLTVAGTNLQRGLVFKLADADGVTVKNADLNGMETQEDACFILDQARDDSGNFSGDFIVEDVRFSFINGATANTTNVAVADSVIQTNPTVIGNGTPATVAALTVVPVVGFTANKKYSIMLVRDKDALEFDTYKFEDLPGCENTTQTAGKLTCQAVQWGDIRTRNAIMRLDLPYIAKIVDKRLMRLIYIEMA